MRLYRPTLMMKVLLAYYDVMHVYIYSFCTVEPTCEAVYSGHCLRQPPPYYSHIDLHYASLLLSKLQVAKLHAFSTSLKQLATFLLQPLILAHG